MKELNEQAEIDGLKKVNTDKIRIILNYWVMQDLIKREYSFQSQNHMKIRLQKEVADITTDLNLRIELSEFILQYLENINVSRESTVFFLV